LRHRRGEKGYLETSKDGSRLLKAFAIQVEFPRRLRHGTGQYARVERVQILEGSQTVIGNSRARGGEGEGLATAAVSWQMGAYFRRSAWRLGANPIMARRGLQRRPAPVS
jgi:hypothetical protein